MHTYYDNQLVTLLQNAISPVVLISGVGLLVLSITNRFARTTDKARVLASEREEAGGESRVKIDRQIKILYRRSRVLLWSASMALTSVLFAVVLVVTLFTDFLLDRNFHAWIVLFFMLSLGSLAVSVLLFIQDMSLSLRALREEVGEIL